jgi:hypothetical protein
MTGFRISSGRWWKSIKEEGWCTDPSTFGKVIGEGFPLAAVDKWTDGSPVKILNVTAVTILDHIRNSAGCEPAYLRMDYGPEFIAGLLQDRCSASQIKATYIESFNTHLSDELLAQESFDSVWEIQMMLEEHKRSYNQYRPHSCLGNLTSRRLPGVGRRRIT